jgi:hypothetical protein
LLKRKVTKPYSPVADMASEAIQKDGIGISSPQQMPASVALNSTFGSSEN